MRNLLFGIMALAVCAAAANALDEPPLLTPSKIIPYPLDPVPVLTAEGARALIRPAALKHKVPAAVIQSIMAAESHFNHAVVSPKGAIGLMQLMPATAMQFGADPTIPEQNVDAGTHYLRVLMDRYKKYRNWLKRVIAAYNAGPGAVDRFHGVPPYPETRTYVARVLEFMREFQHGRA